MTDHSASDTEVQETLLEPLEGDEAPEEAGEKADGMIRKKQVYDHVTVSTGLRKREVREAVDATLAYLAQCLAEGRECQLPPLGKIRAISKGKSGKFQYRLVLQAPKGGKEDAAPDESEE